MEHDEDTMYAADHMIDMGPGAGIHGGEVVAQGTVEDIKACKESLSRSVSERREKNSRTGDEAERQRKIYQKSRVRSRTIWTM